MRPQIARNHPKPQTNPALPRIPPGIPTEFIYYQAPYKTQLNSTEFPGLFPKFLNFPRLGPNFTKSREISEIRGGEEFTQSATLNRINSCDCEPLCLLSSLLVGSGLVRLQVLDREWLGCPAIWDGTSRDQKNFMQENIGLIFVQRANKTGKG